MKKIAFFLGLLFVLNANAQFVGTPYMPANTGDKILAALSTNASAYNSAASNALVEITSAEYSAILTSLSGAALKGIDNFTGQSALGSYNDMIGVGPNFTVLPANSYVAAVALSTYITATGAIAVTCSNALGGTSICLTGSSASLTWSTYTVKYFAVKKPTTHCGSNTFLGRLSTSGNVPAAGKSTGSSQYNQTVSAACGTTCTNPLPWSPCLQVITTTSKQW